MEAPGPTVAAQRSGNLIAETRSQPGLGEYLVREGYITQTQFNRALDVQHETHRSMGRVLVELGLITEAMRMDVLEKRFGFERILLKDLPIDRQILHIIPHSFAEKHRLVPVRQEPNQSLVVAMEDPSDILVVDAIKKQIGLVIIPYVASHDDIQVVLDRYHAPGPEAAPEVEKPGGHGILFRLVRATAFPVLALLPLVGFLGALATDAFDLNTKLNRMINVDKNLSMQVLVIYTSLGWALWTIILYEINGLIFGHGRKNEEEGEEEF